ncbi:MAG: AIR synthase related protein [Calditrichia bacterium]
MNRINMDLITLYNQFKNNKNSPAFKVRPVRDLLITELDNNLMLVVASDSDGGIGPKPSDNVRISGYELGRLAVRVPMLEMLASGALPLFIVDVLAVEMEPTGRDIIRGVREEVAEAGLDGSAVVTGSTEDNIPTIQTGMGVVAIGLVSKNDFRPGSSLPGDTVICVGIPKSGMTDKIHYADPEIADLKAVKTVRSIEGIHDILPVGSKGIGYELDQLAQSAGLSSRIEDPPAVDLKKSAGPSTCFLVSLPAEKIDLVRQAIQQPVKNIGSLWQAKK